MKTKLSKKILACVIATAILASLAIPALAAGEETPVKTPPTPVATQTPVAVPATTATTPVATAVPTVVIQDMVTYNVTTKAPGYYGVQARMSMTEAEKANIALGDKVSIKLFCGEKLIATSTTKKELGDIFKNTYNNITGYASTIFCPNSDYPSSSWETTKWVSDGNDMPTRFDVVYIRGDKETVVTGAKTLNVNFTDGESKNTLSWAQVFSLSSLTTGATIKTPEELTRACALAKDGDVITIANNIGTARNNTNTFVIKAPNVTVKSNSATKHNVYGSFVVTGENAKFENLTILNGGEPNGNTSTEARSCITGAVKKMTVTNCVFDVAKRAGNNSGISNGIVIFSTDANTNLAITGSTFLGNTGNVGGYQPAGIIITEGIAYKQFLVDANASLSGKKSVDTTVANEKDIALKNTFTNCISDYDHSDWSNGYKTNFIAVSSGDSLNIGYLTAKGTLLINGSVAMSENTSDLPSSATIEITPKGTLTIPQDKTLSIPSSGTIINNGTLIVKDTVARATAGALNNNGTFTNNGTLAVNGGTVTNQLAGNLTNSGVLNVTKGSLTSINGATLTNSGTLAVNGGTVTNQSGATLTNSGVLNVTAGTLTSAGAITNNGVLAVNGGTVTNNGTLTNNKTIVAPAGTITGNTPTGNATVTTIATAHDKTAAVNTANATKTNVSQVADGVLPSGVPAPTRFNTATMFAKLDAAITAVNTSAEDISGTIKVEILKATTTDFASSTKTGTMALPSTAPSTGTGSNGGYYVSNAAPSVTAAADSLAGTSAELQEGVTAADGTAITNPTISVTEIDPTDPSNLTPEMKKFLEASNGFAIAKILSINFYDGTTKITKLANGFVKVTIPFTPPANAPKDAKFYILHKDEDGGVTVIPLTMNEDGTASFLTNRFSTYAIAIKSDKADMFIKLDTAPTVVPKPNKPTINPATGVSLLGQLF